MSMLAALLARRKRPVVEMDESDIKDLIEIIGKMQAKIDMLDIRVDTLELWKLEQEPKKNS